MWNTKDVRYGTLLFHEVRDGRQNTGRYIHVMLIDKLLLF